MFILIDGYFSVGHGSTLVFVVSTLVVSSRSISWTWTDRASCTVRVTPRWFGSYLGDLGGRRFEIGRRMRSVLGKMKWLFNNSLLCTPSKTARHLLLYADCPKPPNTYSQTVQNLPTSTCVAHPKPPNTYVQTTKNHPTPTYRPSKSSYVQTI